MATPLEIDVTIRGEQGSGKTLLAQKLILFLRQQPELKGSHLIISTTNADPCTYEIEHNGVIGG